MGELVFVGLGLNNELDISLKGLEELKTAKTVFVEFYTSFMPEFSLYRFKSIIKKPVNVVSREILEEQNGIPILEEAKRGKTVLLVPGDPLIATTHIALRVQAEREGLSTRIVHGASIITAAIGLSGLHNYKFGGSVTISFPDGDRISETPYNIIQQNKTRGLHTLCFLDVKSKEERYMTVNEGLQLLLSLEEANKLGVVTPLSLVVGIARAGSEKPLVKAGSVEKIVKQSFGSPPHTLIFPGQLHFMEKEALTMFAEAPADALEVKRCR